jgi:PAS domain-containing protein
MSDNFSKLVELTKTVIKEEMTLQALVDASTDGYWDWHITKDYEYMSRRFWEILKQDPDSKNNHPSEWLALVHPDDIASVKQSIGEYLQKLQTDPSAIYKNSIRFLCDGEIIHVLCRGSVIEWEGDQPSRMVGTHTDITDLAKR